MWNILVGELKMREYYTQITTRAGVDAICLKTPFTALNYVDGKPLKHIRHNWPKNLKFNKTLFAN